MSFLLDTQALLWFLLEDNCSILTAATSKAGYERHGILCHCQCKPAPLPIFVEVVPVRGAFSVTLSVMIV